MGLMMKLNIVNKCEYEENQNYREVIIRIPKEVKKLEQDFRYLGLDYNNLLIQDTHILKCTVIDTDNPQISSELTREITSIIDKANQNGYTTTYQDIKKMFAIINRLDSEDRDKLLAVLELKRDNISNMNDAIKYANNLDCFILYSDIERPEDYARQIIEDGDVLIEDIMEYIDLSTLGEDYCDKNGGRQTDYGLVIEETYVDEIIRNSEEEEEFG